MAAPQYVINNGLMDLVFLWVKPRSQASRDGPAVADSPKPVSLQKHHFHLAKRLNWTKDHAYAGITVHSNPVSHNAAHGIGTRAGISSQVERGSVATRAWGRAVQARAIGPALVKIHESCN